MVDNALIEIADDLFQRRKLNLQFLGSTPG
jgi:hypothetical protein